MRSLRLWTWFLILALAGHAALEVYLWHDAWRGAPLGRVPAAQRWGWTMLVTAATCVALWCLWQWTAAANIRDRVRHHLRFRRDKAALRHDRPDALVFGPAAILWWFVPILNLWTPYLAMAEIRDRSTALGGRTHGSRAALRLWWLLLLSLPLTGLLHFVLVWSTGLRFRTWMTVATARDLVLVGVAAYVVWRVNALQEAWPSVDPDELGTRGRAPGGL